MDFSSDIEITDQLTSGDLDKVVELHREVYAKEYAYSDSFVQYVKTGLFDFFKQYDTETDKAWICRFEGKLKGFLLLVHHDSSNVQLRYFILSEDLRGKGLGDKMMNEFIAFMKAKNYSHAFLYTTSELPAAAHLYTKYGFKLTGAFPSDRFGKPVVEQRYDLWIQ